MTADRSMNFGSALRLLRVNAGLSLRELAARVGVSGAYLSRVENGRDPAPTPDRLAAIAEALQLRPDTLVELAQQTASALSDYIERVPAASAFFLEVARRELDADKLARLRAIMDEEFPPASLEATTLLSSLIGRRIVLGLACSGVDAVIAAGAARCLPGGSARAGEVANRIREREQSSPTALGNGLMVPHAVVPGAPTAAALVTLAEPLPHDTPDGAPIEVAIVLVSGVAGRRHLELLAQVARLAGLGACAELRGARTAAEARAVIERAETT